MNHPADGVYVVHYHCHEVAHSTPPIQTPPADTDPLISANSELRHAFPVLIRVEYCIWVILLSTYGTVGPLCPMQVMQSAQPPAAHGVSPTCMTCFEQHKCGGWTHAKSYLG